MKRIISCILAFSMACLLFTSCKKSGIETVKQPSLLSSSENRVAIAKALKTYFEHKDMASSGSSSASSNGAEFVVPFFTSEGINIGRFDFANFTLELASFSAGLSGSDFLRKNPDGSYSVHVNSNNALAEYYENLFDPAALSLYGTGAHMAADYTGELIELSIYDGDGNLMFVIRFIDTFESRNALSLHGNGNVGPNGAGPWKKLSAKVVQTPGGQSHVDFSLK